METNYLLVPRGFSGASRGAFDQKQGWKISPARGGKDYDDI